MQDESNPSSVLVKPRVSIWRRLGGGSLTISLLVHASILALGVVVIVGIIPPPPEKVVDFSGGGSQGGPATNVQQKKRATMIKNTASRVVAKDVVSSFTLPDPETSSDMSALSALGAGVTNGLGGMGSGVKGLGPSGNPGGGMGPGLGGNAGYNPFGMIDLTANALVGTFYDMKQTPKREPTDMSTGQLVSVIKEFVNGGWKEREFDKYYQSPQKLSQTKVYIPAMSADAAPAAFKCEKEVAPSRWVVIYRGTVTPPWTGKYRFVGAGDDIMVVRFNKKNVFDFGFISGTAGAGTAFNPAFLETLKGEGKGDSEFEKKLGRDYAMKIPMTFYQYETTKNWNSQLGGIAQGPEFEAVAGTPYPIEILISEVPGGLFGAALMIEKTGEKYQSTSTGAPILPIFQLDGTLPKVEKNADNAPPFDKKGPVWNLVKDSGKTGI